VRKGFLPLMPLGVLGDASSWYWAALLGKSSGPWWAVTTIEVAPEP
jgi:hypothetical protein